MKDFSYITSAHPSYIENLYTDLKTNPIRQRKDRGANIELQFYGFTEADLDKEFQAGKLIGLGTTTLRNIFNFLEKCYASHVGIEFKYISDQKKVDWLTNEVEKKM